MRYFVQGIVLLWLGVAAAALICYVTRPFVSSPAIRMGLAILPLYGAFCWWIFKPYRANNPLAGHDKQEITDLCLLLIGIWILPLVSILEMIAVWSESFHPVRDDSSSPESMPGWWTSHAIIALAATLISLWLLRRWSRGERWMFGRLGRLTAFTWLLYALIMGITHWAFLSLGFTERQARPSLSRQKQDSHHVAV